MRSPAAICTGSCRDEKRDGSPQAFARVWSIKGSLFRRLQGAMKGVSTLVSEPSAVPWRLDMPSQPINTTGHPVTRVFACCIGSFDHRDCDLDKDLRECKRTIWPFSS
jgi:hypothetical protein